MQDLNLEDGSVCLLIRGVFSKDECVSMMTRLGDDIDWHRETIKVYGKECRQNRTTAQYGEDGCSYSYSGTKHTGTGCIPEVLRYIQKIGAKRLINLEAISDNNFNYFLLNRYKDGSENIGEHSDDEKGLSGPIVSFSFGASRFFDIRKKKDKSKLRLNVHSGDCIVMSGNMQRYYKHGIPIQRKILEERFSVTLREII